METEWSFVYRLCLRMLPAVVLGTAPVGCATVMRGSRDQEVHISPPPSMKFATRKPDDLRYDDEEAKRVSSINVLTAIEALDRFAAAELGFPNDNGMTTWYGRLCEFSHPNCLGNSVGTKLGYSSGVEIFEVEPGVRPEILQLFSNYAYLLLYAFCLNYNGSWRMLADAGETLPVWEPSGNPVISLD
jgi:hypothetical protein